MSYIIEFKDFEVELPKYNLDIAGKLEKADKMNLSETKTYEEKIKSLHKLESELIGKDKLEEILETSKLSEVDPNDVMILFLAITDAYNRPVEDYKFSKFDGNIKQVDDMKELMGEMNKIPSTVSAIDKIKK